MSERDLASAEELVAVLTPLKIATTALCEESVLTLSMILPLQQQMVNYITREDDDSALIKQVKKEVVDDFSTRCQDTCTKKDLTVATLLYFISFLFYQERFDSGNTSLLYFFTFFTLLFLYFKPSL